MLKLFLETTVQTNVLKKEQHFYKTYQKQFAKGVLMKKGSKNM